jgi:hypothetical protein
MASSPTRAVRADLRRYRQGKAMSVMDEITIAVICFVGGIVFLTLFERLVVFATNH